jgi:hypothetical protein
MADEKEDKKESEKQSEKEAAKADGHRSVSDAG